MDDNSKNGVQNFDAELQQQGANNSINGENSSGIGTPEVLKHAINPDLFIGRPEILDENVNVNVH